ncbi:MAG: choice-of-anchor Q domain-containing protein, partial [Caldilineaceae bacterium]
LLPYSPALDAGSCTDISGAPVLTDQRGELRPQGAGCDLGAFESPLSTILLPVIRYLPVIQNKPN